MNDSASSTPSARTGASPRLQFQSPERYSTGMKLEEILLNQDPKSGLPAHMSRWEVGPGGSSPLDHHRVRECWFIASGSGELTFKGEEKMEVAAGDILYFDSWESHEVKNTGQTTLSVFSIWWPGDPET